MAALLSTVLESDNIALARADGGTLEVIPIPSSSIATAPTLRTITSGTTAANPLGETVIFDTTGGAIDYQLPAIPTPGVLWNLMWKAGGIPPTIDGNGKLVGGWIALNQSSAGTQVINQLGGNGTLTFDGTQWWWVS